MAWQVSNYKAISQLINYLGLILEFDHETKQKTGI